jgi:hypothetical protein
MVIKILQNKDSSPAVSPMASLVHGGTRLQRMAPCPEKKHGFFCFTFFTNAA